MNELSDELYDSIIQELEQGDDASEGGFLKSALKHYENALTQIPIPKTDWEIALHVYTALGDCCFDLEDYPSANYHYNKALLCPDGIENGYIWLGLGQSFCELGEIEKARDALMRAYMLEGQDIFEDEDEKYFDMIKQMI